MNIENAATTEMCACGHTAASHRPGACVGCTGPACSSPAVVGVGVETLQTPEKTQQRESWERLAELAAAATPGPWTLSEPDGNWISPHVCNTYGYRREDAAYIAAASPDVVAGLVAEVVRLEADVARTRGVLVVAQDQQGIYESERDEADEQLRAVRIVVAKALREYPDDMTALAVAAAVGITGGTE